LLDWIILAGISGLIFAKRTAIKARFKEYWSAGREAKKQRRLLKAKYDQLTKDTASGMNSVPM
jgi:hypothetical protein